MSEIQYRPEIDGLRAVAVVPVVLFHMDLDWIPGGFLGVDVFFVISGYLISSIILREYETNTFTFVKFWARRVRRIFPALMTMLLATSLASAYLMFKGDTIDFGIQGVAAALSFANLAMLRLFGDYWGPAANSSPYLHTWSLSVEEQFYLFYPFVLIFLLRFARKLVRVALGLALAASFLVYLYGYRYHPMGTFYLLPTRAWELACGCLLAASTWRTRDHPPGRVRAALSTAGLVAVVASFFAFSEARNFNGYLAVPVVGSALVIAFAGDVGSLVGRILSLPAVVYTGKVSYSLYLWHWPIIVLGKQLRLPGGGTPPMYLLAAPIAAISILSYQYIETPTRRRSAASATLRLSFGLLVASLLVSSYLYMRSPYYDISMYSPVTYLGGAYQVNPVDNWNKKKMTGVVVPERYPLAADAYATGGLIKRYGGPTPELVVFGDSHAAMWSGAIDGVARELGVTVSFYAADATHPFIRLPLAKSGGEWTQEFDRKRLDFLEEWKPKVVVLAARWPNYEIETANYLVESCGRVGAKVVLIEQPPELYFGDRNTVQYLAFLRLFPRGGERQYVESADVAKQKKGNEAVQSLCRDYPFCRSIRVFDLFSQEDRRAWVLDGPQVLYIDDDHLSQDGTERARGRLLEGIRSALIRP